MRLPPTLLGKSARSRAISPRSSPVVSRNCRRTAGEQQTLSLYVMQRSGREIHRDQDLRFVAKGYSLVSAENWNRTLVDEPLPEHAYFWYRAKDSLWWLGQVQSSDTTNAFSYRVSVVDDPGSIRITLLSHLCINRSTAGRGS